MAALNRNPIPSALVSPLLALVLLLGVPKIFFANDAVELSSTFDRVPFLLHFSSTAFL